MTFSTGNPFFDPVPDSVALAFPPLSGVLVQVSFPEILSIADKYFVGSFQEKIRKNFPHNHLDHNFTFKSIHESQNLAQTPNWRFFDESRYWRVSLTTNYLSIETRRYVERMDLIRRVVELVEALSSTINPNYLSRFGVRYVNRVFGDPLDRLADIVRPEVTGVYSSAQSMQVERATSEIFARINSASLVARWGFMPTGQTHNPELMPSIDVPSWYLDTDVFQTFDQLVKFESFDFRKTSSDLASRAYSFFRWVVNDDFLRLYGGEV